MNCDCIFNENNKCLFDEKVGNCELQINKDIVKAVVQNANKVRT